MLPFARSISASSFLSGGIYGAGVFQLLFVAIIVGAILVFEVKGNGLILLESILACIIGPCAAAAAVVTLKLGAVWRR